MVGGREVSDFADPGLRRMSRPGKLSAELKRVRASDRRLEPWMTANYSALEREYGGGRLNLKELLAIALANKLTNDHGGPPTEATISKTWVRVRARKARTASPSSPEPRKFPPGVVELPIPGQVSAREDARGRAAAEGPSRALQRAAPQNVPAQTSLAGGVAPRAPPVAPSGHDPGPAGGLSADEQIARFRSDQRAGSRGMPKSLDDSE